MEYCNLSKEASHFRVISLMRNYFLTKCAVPTTIISGYLKIFMIVILRV